tara:strand:+ start:4314 stop:4745 length:432 start_codon:yes stop_codon:yes gene_type:complete
MRHTIEFNIEERWALTTFHGPVSIDETVVLLRQLVSSPQWTPACDRIIDYNDGLLGDLDVPTVQGAKSALGDVLQAAYGDKPSLSAQVCANPMQRPLVEYWISLGAAGYPAGLKLFDSVAQARAWILASREPGGAGTDQAQPV